MTTPQEKAKCVSWFIKTKSDIQAQRNFIAKYIKRPQHVSRFAIGISSLWERQRCY